MTTATTTNPTAAAGPFEPRRRESLAFTRPVLVDPSGFDGPTKAQAAGPDWRRTGCGLYVPSAVDADRPEQRAVEALTAVTGSPALTGWAALYVHGAAYFDGRRRDGSPRPVQVAVGPGQGRRTRLGSRLSYEMLPAAEVEVVDGLAVTSPARALFDELRCPPNARELVVAADMAIAAGLGSVSDFLHFARSRASWRRASWVEAVFDHVSGRSCSPPETRLRLTWTLDAGLPPPLVNVPVFTLTGEQVCIADLLDVEAGLVVEYDGAEHRTVGRHARDAARFERIRDAGLEMTSFTSPDVDHTRRVVERLRGARRRSAFLPEGARRWTLEVPPGWVPPLWLPPMPVAV